MGRYSLRAWAAIAILSPPLALIITRTGGEFPEWSQVFFWFALLALAELMPIALGHGPEVTMSVPIHLALVLIFPPWVAVLIAGAAALDLRELRRKTNIESAFFNRFQIMLAVGASAVVLDLHSGSDFSPLPIALASIAHLVINLGLVALAVSDEARVPINETLKTLIPSPIVGFFLSYAAVTALGGVTALAHERVDPWAAAAILIPILFARLSVIGARAQQELTEKVQKQQKALLDATQRAFEEREAERHRIAEHIHDSSLQLLAAAAYGCENTLTHMDSDRPDEARTTVSVARAAVDEAIKSLRNSLVDLRRSAVEEGGLIATVKKFTDQVSTLWGVKIELRGELTYEPPIPVSLGALQILQEGLMNSVKHSKTDWIFVWIGERGGTVHVIVEDRGEGFDPNSHAAGEDHVGLKLMSERAERLGGYLDIRSNPGDGTRLEAILPSGVGT